ncbi:MAG: hypothetical protein IKG15_02205 [Solobacterium sp.]|nr:hypothetical protein [Solobacterium sp.]
MRSDTRTLVLLAVETAVLEVAKRALDFLPNVELITFLFIVFTLKTGVKKTLIVSLIFSFIEMMIFGIGTWTMVYFYIWPLLILMVHFLPKNSGRLTYAVTAGAFGLFFGMLCAPVTFVIGGWQAAAAWWVAGIPYDLIHCVSNFIVCFVLFDPVMKAMEYIPF